MRRLIPFTLTLTGVALAASAALAASPNPDNGMTLAQAVNGSWRTPAYVKRDKYRHPLKALEFFGLKPDMTVVELEPAGGWWTEILAPYLKAKGQLIEAIPPASSTGFMMRLRSHFMDKIKADPALYGKIKTVDFAPPETVDLGPADSADVVLTFRNLHDWEMGGGLKQVFAAAYKVLKPGGVFGVVAHRALPFTNPEDSAHKLHRLPEDFVIQLGLDAGFRLAAVSEINANPKDPMTINIHRLPPTLGMGDTAAQKKKYEKIGESDRMTLKFVKPAASMEVHGG
jgi:predicted methyltransferase